jgi:hypothetical protein
MQIRITPAVALSLLVSASGQGMPTAAPLSLSATVLACARQKANLDFDAKRQLFLATQAPSLPDSLGLLPVLKRLKKSLDLYGAEVVVVLPPAREMLYYSPTVQASDLQARQKYTTNYGVLASTLRAAGFNVVELLSVFQAEQARRADRLLYLRDDFHWNFAGADLAAQELRRSLTNTSPALLKSLGTSKFDILTSSNSLVVGAYQNKLTEACPTYQVIPTARTNVNIIERNFDLFATVPVTTLLIGTSYSTWSNQAFGQLSSARLRTPVANEAVAAGGIQASFLQAFSKDDYALQHMKLLIWEFPATHPGSNKLNNLADPSFLRQLLPAIERGGSVLSQSTFKNIAGKASLKNLGTQARTRMYLKIKLNNGGARKFQLALNYGKTAETVRLERPKGSVTDTYYFDLPDSVRSLSAVTLSGLAGNVTQVTLQVIAHRP